MEDGHSPRNLASPVRSPCRRSSRRVHLALETFACIHCAGRVAPSGRLCAVGCRPAHVCPYTSIASVGLLPKVLCILVVSGCKLLVGGAPAVALGCIHVHIPVAAVTWRVTTSHVWPGTMAHRPTSPGPRTARGRRSRDLDLSFRVARHSGHPRGRSKRPSCGTDRRCPGCRCEPGALPQRHRGHVGRLGNGLSRWRSSGEHLTCAYIQS